MSGFRVYATIDQRAPLSTVAAHAQRAEALGYDGLAVPDAVHDGLAAAAIALQATTRLRVATSVLVAFPRSPMTVAVAAWDLQEMSKGRFELGLGSQVRGNIVGRYSTTWAAPVPRMREYVQSLRAIFKCWQEETELHFEGEHYQFTRMQPFFKPAPIEEPDIPIYLGGMKDNMVALAGETADGLMTHPTNTSPRYLREAIRPHLDRGAKRSDRSPGSASLMVCPLTITGPNDEVLAAERERTQQLLTFLYSTPAYWPSLALFGWQERGEALNALVREGKWNEMGNIVDEEMLSTLAPIGGYDTIASVLGEWYGELCDWITFPMPTDAAHDQAAAAVIERLRSG